LKAVEDGAEVAEDALQNLYINPDLYNKTIPGYL